MSTIKNPTTINSSAWHCEASLSTPAGEPVRILYESEIAMGGPLICAYLLPDGIVINGVGSSAGFSPDGRWFFSPVPSRRDWDLVIIDREQHLLHHCNEKVFWEIDVVTNTSITGRCSPLTQNKTNTREIADLIAAAITVPLVQLSDLWIPRHYWTEYCEMPELPRGAAGAMPVSMSLWLPDGNLSSYADPMDPLWCRLGELQVAGEPTGLLLRGTDPDLVWSEEGDNGQAFACRAVPISEARKWQGRMGSMPMDCWLWSNGTVRRLVCNQTPRWFQRSPQSLVRLDANYLDIEWKQFQPELTRGTSGTISALSGGALHIDGQSFEPPTFLQRIPVGDPATSSHRDEELLESAPLVNGKRLTWRFLRKDSDLSENVYVCTFNGQHLPEEWLIDHRVSADRENIALLAYDAPPLIPHRIAILCARTDSLSWLDGDFYRPYFQGFSTTTLYFIHLTGRLNDDSLSADSPLPPLDQARPFLLREPAYDLHYCRESIDIRTGKPVSCIDEAPRPSARRSILKWIASLFR